MHAGDLVSRRFRIEELAGEGGMAKVYRALDLTTGRSVALKMMLADRPIDEARFLREARLLLGLRHPGIVAYVDHGRSEDGAAYLAMEWLSGTNLLEHLRVTPRLAVEDTLVLFERIAEALAAAHTRGIVHRDLKPSNILLGDGRIDRAKLIDFGIAHAPRDERLTSTGAVLGTPGYMSPEQARGAGELDPRSDIFSLGCILFRCLTGRMPFQGNAALSVLMKLLLEETPSILTLRPGVPAGLVSLIERMLAKSPSGRPRDAATILAELHALDTVECELALPEARSTITTDEERVGLLVIAQSPQSNSETPTNDRGRPRLPLAMLVAAAERNGGRLDVLADGSLLVTIRWGEVATDEAASAARCALAMRRHLPDWPMAIVSGRTAPSRRAPSGDSIDRALELMWRANENGIALDPVVANLLDARFEVRRDVSGHHLRAEHPTVDAMRMLLGRPTPCVGRDRELDMLDVFYQSCVNEPSAMAALVVAAPGMGKSRLRNEFSRRRAADPEPPEVFAARAANVGAGSSFALCAQLVRSAAGIREGESHAVQLRKLATRVGRDVPAQDAQRVTAFLAEMIGAEEEDDSQSGAAVQLHAARENARIMGDQLSRAFLDLVASQCRKSPLVISIDDLQWGDLTSVKLLDRALLELDGAPLFVVATARPSVHAAFPRLWAERPMQVFPLRELSRRASESLVTFALGQRCPTAITARIVTRAAGNAFYLEELIRAEFEGRSDALPQSVLAMTQARLETLEVDARLVLRAASVFGEVFWRGGVCALVGEERTAQVDEWLAEFVEREIIVVRPPEKFLGERTYAFRHAILREAAYEMLTAEDRMLAHRVAAEWLERAGETDPLVLAEHCERSDAREGGARWLLQAAEQAFEGNDDAAVLGHANRGIACRAQGETLAGLLFMKSRGLMNGGGLAEAEQALIEAMRLLDPSSKRWLSVMRIYTLVVSGRGQRARLVELATKLLEDGLEEKPSSALVQLWTATTRVVYYDGELALGDRLAAEVDRVVGVTGDPITDTDLHMMRGTRADMRGDPAAYLGDLRAAVRCAEESGDLRSIAIAMGNAGHANAEVGAYEEAERVVRIGLRGLEQLGLVGQHATTLSNLGHILFALGRLDEARSVGEEAVRLLEALQQARVAGYARIYLARVLLRQGELSSAEQSTRQVIDDPVAGDPLRAQALALLAVICLQSSRADEAIAHAERAMTILESAGAIGEGEAGVRLAWAESLRAGGDARAGDAIDSARRWVLERASKISEDALRESFLHRQLDNARILAFADA